LGNYFMNRIMSEDKRYIVETHSEYILNRIRLLIAKGKIDPADVATYYFHRVGRKVNACPIKFTTSGKIEGAPPEFFDTYMMDVMDIAMEAV
jgi:predicted ATPase